MKKLIKFCLSSFVILGLISCQNEPNVSKVVAEDSYTKYVPMSHAHGKQGAAVSLVDSKVNLAAAGVQYSINLGIDSKYSSGDMILTVSASEGLYIVSGETDIKQKLTKGVMQFPFEVMATEAGHYYLHAIIRVKRGALKTSRALNMIVEVGLQDSEVSYTKNAVQFKSALTQEDTTEIVVGSPILLPADEEIIK